MQKGQVIAYVSRQLKIHEENYTTYDLELGAVAFALNTWRHYLYRTKSVIYTDHKSLQHIFDQKELKILQRQWIELFSDYDCQIRYHLGKANMVVDALSRKGRVKPIQVRAVSMTILSNVKEKDIGCSSYHLSIRHAPFEALYGRKFRSPVLLAEIRESWLIGQKFVQETTGKVVLIKERLKAAKDHQKSYVDNRRKPLEFELGPFEILKMIGHVPYRLRLPKEFSSVHDTFHVSNLKKRLADANLHVPLEEIKVDKILRFVKEPVKSWSMRLSG
nr:putative reverse transcriptase domain-containing protein [Tanacetum cinerariifolium]